MPRKPFRRVKSIVHTWVAGGRRGPWAGVPAGASGARWRRRAHLDARDEVRPRHFLDTS